MTTTPPLQASVHVPPTPRHGAKFDTYRPYSHHKVVDRSEPTDLPGTFAPLHRSHTDAKSRLRRGISPSSSNEMLHQAEGNNVTGRRTRNHSLRDSKRQKSPLSADTAAMGSSLDPKNAVSLLLQAPDHGLPTPAKTPRKKAAETSSAISSTARVLFPSNDEDTLPTPQKKGRRSRRHAGFFLDNSFEGPEHEEHIKIFTDSKEKVPELDTTEDNPFYSNPLNEGVSKAWETKSKKNRKTDVTSSQFIEEAFNHEEGMVYVL
ncbi:MAG: hypothetical protein LQ342_000134 [Letrouitia transgressa]|nr:MAG: hypothetical protein LQ342_000134 [Letrouitia transgressa]